MPLLQVISSRPKAGKTAIATGIAQGSATRGTPVRLLRAGSSDAAKADATAFSRYIFATSPAEPTAREKVEALPGVLTIVELEAGEEPLGAAGIVVVREEPNEGDVALARALGENLAGSIATLVRPARIDEVARALTDMGLRPLALIPEDAGLAAPSVEDIRHTLAADVLYEGENFETAIDRVLVAPVYTDGAKPYFERYAGTTAVLAPSYKTDLLLAALEANASCVVVTGGHRPSHYVIDRVQGQPTTILLAQHQTPAAVAALSSVWTSSAFAGEAKAQAIFSLLEGRLDWESFAKKVS